MMLKEWEALLSATEIILVIKHFAFIYSNNTDLMIFTTAKKKIIFYEPRLYLVLQKIRSILNPKHFVEPWFVDLFYFHFK